MESLESGAREKRWNTARRHVRLCSFSFSGHMTGHPAKREKREREALARDGAAAGVELDAELEGALTRLMAYASLAGAAVSLATAQQVLRSIIASQEKRVTIEVIQKRDQQD